MCKSDSVYMYVYVCFGPYTKQQEQQGEDSWMGVMMMMIRMEV